METWAIADLVRELAKVAGYDVQEGMDGSAFMEFTLTGERTTSAGWPMISFRINVNRATPERVVKRTEAAIEKLRQFVADHSPD